MGFYFAPQSGVLTKIKSIAALGQNHRTPKQALPAQILGSLTEGHLGTISSHGRKTPFPASHQERLMSPAITGQGWRSIVALVDPVIP